MKKAFTFFFVAGLGCVFLLLFAIHRSEASGWMTSYSDYSYSSYSGRSGGGESVVISLDLDPQNSLDRSFRVSVREGRLADATRLFVKGVEINSGSDNGDTALMYASRNCSSKLVNFLLSHGADVNAVNLEGKTPLIFAVRESCTRVVELLLKKPEIKMDVKDQSRKTALDYAGETALLEVDGPSQKIIQMIEEAKQRANANNRTYLPKKKVS